MTTPQPARTYNQDHVARKARPANAGQHLLDLELSVGNQPRSHRVGQPFSSMTEVRRVAWPSFEPPSGTR